MKYLIQGYKGEKPILGSDTQVIVEYKRLSNLKRYGVPKTKKAMEKNNADTVKVYSFANIYDENTYQLVADLYTKWIPKRRQS